MTELDMCCGTTCDKAKVKAEFEAIKQERDELAAQVERLRGEFPLFDDEGLDPYEHHCEWAMQQDRKRLHKILSETQPAALSSMKAKWQADGAIAAWVELKRMGMAQAGSKNVIQSLVKTIRQRAQEAGE